jgi:RNA polymerase sigma-70 factor (ECF subfamily)
MALAGTTRDVISQQLVLRAQAGDRSALDAVLRALAPALLPYAAALASDRREAEILLADTLSRVFERLDQLSQPAAILPWSRQVLVHMFIDGGRRLRRRREYSIDAVSVPAASPESEEILDLRHAVDGLGRSDRALLVLHYWLGLTLPECAEELAIPVGTAKSRLHATLERLRGAMGGS